MRLVELVVVDFQWFVDVVVIPVVNHYTFLQEYFVSTEFLKSGFFQYKVLAVLQFDQQY